MRQSPGPDFEFEEWALLAKTDPRAFEERRKEAIEHLIVLASHSNQAKLRGLQWKIDIKRTLARNHFSACIWVFNQMWISVYGENGLLNSLRSFESGLLPERPCADVLEFQRRHSGQWRNKASYPSKQP